MTTPSIKHEPGWVADASSFGARLALIRQRMGWGNVEKAARECGVPVETWRSWERDNREPSRLVTIAMAISTRTGCDFLWLVHGPARGGAEPLSSVAEPNGRCDPRELAEPNDTWSGQRLIRRVPQLSDPGIVDESNSAHANHRNRAVAQTRPTSRLLGSRPLTPVAL